MKAPGFAGGLLLLSVNYCHMTEVEIKNPFRVSILLTLFFVILLFFIFVKNKEDKEILVLGNNIKIGNKRIDVCEKIVRNDILWSIRHNISGCNEDIVLIRSKLISSAILNGWILIIYFEKDAVVGKGFRVLDGWFVPCEAPADEGKIEPPERELSCI
jgi:hypothetical protein